MVYNCLCVVTMKREGYTYLNIALLRDKILQNISPIYIFLIMQQDPEILKIYIPLWNASNSIHCQMLTVKSTICFLELIKEILIFQLVTFLVCVWGNITRSHKCLYITKSVAVRSSQNKSCHYPKMKENFTCKVVTKLK